MCLLVFSKQNLIATKSGLQLWASSILPALLPFLIATELLTYTNVIEKLGKFSSSFMKKLFNVPGIASFAFIMGIISGSPVGAKIVTNFRNKKLCTQDEGNRLLVYTNNSGPLFIIGAVGVGLFQNSLIGIVLFISHFLSCATTGFFLGLISRLKSSIHKKRNLATIHESPQTDNSNFSSFGEILTSSIVNSINTILLIGGFIVLFSVIISILESSKILTIISLLLKPVFQMLNINSKLILPLVSGFFEITNGLQSISVVNIKDISTSLCLSSFLLGFGGLSIATQVLGIISKSDLSIKKYLSGKLLQGTINSLYTYIFFTKIPILNLNIESVFSNQSKKLSTTFDTTYILILLIFIGLIFAYKFAKRHIIKL